MTAPPPPLDPPALRALDPRGADELLDRLERSVPVHPPVLTIPGRPDADAIVFGDTHGDWPSTVEAARLFEQAPGRFLVGLGDYVDRSPPDLEDGSVVNALYLLGLAARFPERVVLVQGNHETVRRIPALPSELPEEVDELWGPDATRLERLLGLLERGPLAVITESGAYLAHAGFPRGRLPDDWKETIDFTDERRLIEMVWSECTAARSRRGIIEPWSEGDLMRFLAATSTSLMLRGHDPELTGRPLYDGRCLTLQTTRVFERFGGVIVAELPLGDPVRSVADLTVRHLPTEHRHYGAD